MVNELRMVVMVVVSSLAIMTVVMKIRQSWALEWCGVVIRSFGVDKGEDDDKNDENYERKQSKIGRRGWSMGVKWGMSVDEIDGWTKK